MAQFISFLISVLAKVVSYYICKGLDRLIKFINGNK